MINQMIKKNSFKHSFYIHILDSQTSNPLSNTHLTLYVFLNIRHFFLKIMEIRRCDFLELKSMEI